MLKYMICTRIDWGVPIFIIVTLPSVDLLCSHTMEPPGSWNLSVEAQFSVLIHKSTGGNYILLLWWVAVGKWRTSQGTHASTDKHLVKFFTEGKSACIIIWPWERRCCNLFRFHINLMSVRFEYLGGQRVNLLRRCH